MLAQEFIEHLLPARSMDFYGLGNDAVQIEQHCIKTALGDGSRDGSDNNNSWYCGAEGRPTTRKS
jgi:hypothetical protein